MAALAAQNLIRSESLFASSRWQARLLFVCRYRQENAAGQNTTMAATATLAPLGPRKTKRGIKLSSLYQIRSSNGLKQKRGHGAPD
jgi:hypothetical protein